MTSYVHTERTALGVYRVRDKGYRSHMPDMNDNLSRNHEASDGALISSVEQVERVNPPDPALVQELGRENEKVAHLHRVAAMVYSGAFGTFGVGALFAVHEILAISFAALTVALFLAGVWVWHQAEVLGNEVRARIDELPAGVVTVPAEAASAYRKIREYANDIDNSVDHPIDVVASARLVDEAAPELLTSIANHLSNGTIDSPEGQAQMSEILRIEAEMGAYVNEYREAQKRQSMVARQVEAPADVAGFTAGITFRTATCA